MSGGGRYAWQLAFELSPIIMQGGLAGQIGLGVAGGLLPIIVITEGISLATGLLADGSVPDPDNFFAHFKPLPGMSMFRQTIGKYPFANQTVAGNATIAQPTNVSVLMQCPAKPPGGYLVKLATMTAIQAAVAQHASLGGTYIIATPFLFVPNCVLLDIIDVGGGESKQPQEQWRWDFERPLISLSEADQAQNNLMSKVTNGLPTSGALSGPDVATGFTPSGAAPATAPASSGLAGTSIGTNIAQASVPVVQAPAGGTSFVQ